MRLPIPYPERLSLKIENPCLQFCTLEYRGHSIETHALREATIILLTLKNEEDNLNFLVHPKWRSIVEKHDLYYIESLFLDFLERARSEPAALMEQLSALVIGPLSRTQWGLAFRIILR